MIFLPREAMHRLGPDFYAFTSSQQKVDNHFSMVRLLRRVPALVEKRLPIGLVYLADPGESDRPVCLWCAHEAALDLLDFWTFYRELRAQGRAWTIRELGFIPLVVLQDVEGTWHSLLLRRADVCAFLAEGRAQARQEQQPS